MDRCLSLLALCFAMWHYSAAKIPGFKHCPFEMYFCKSKVCEGIFYKAFRDKSTSDCREKFQELLRCNKRFLLQDCYKDHSPRSSRELDMTLHAQMKEDVFCNVSSFVDTTPRPWGTKPCSDAYYYKVADCASQFVTKFLANKGDPALCREFAATKKCLQKLVDTECRFSDSTLEVLKYQFGDINPFCENMRDPGSDGNQLCVRYFDVTALSSTSSSAFVSAWRFFSLAILTLGKLVS